MRMKTKTIRVPEQLFREATIETYEEKVAANVTEKRFRMSISSDTPYKRYDWMADEHYYEVLDHSPGGMDTSRLDAGLPILFNHKRDQHLARAGSYQCDGKKCTVTDLKWSTSQFAQEKMADAMNGSLPDTSVGYQIMDDGECIGAKDGCPVYKFKWAPYEASLVTIPADITVGVGRERADGEKVKMREISIHLNKSLDEEREESQNSAKPTTMKLSPAIRQHFREEDDGSKATGGSSNIDVTEVETQAVAKERKRVQSIRDLNSFFKSNGIAGRKVDATEIAERFIREGKSAEEFEKTVIRTSLPEIKEVVQSAEIGMSKRDLSQYSLLRAINGVMASVSKGKPFTGLEREASDEAARKHGREPSGLSFFVPHDVMSAGYARGGYSRIEDEDRQRVLQAGVFTGAGAMVPIGAQGQSLIELYRNKMFVVAMGARVLTGLQGTLAIPRQSGGGTASWLSETATITAADQTVGQLTLTPHRLAAATAFTTQLLAQSSPDIESFVRDDLMTVLAIEKDRVCLLGTGASGEPLGIYNTPGLNTTVDITATGSITFAEAVSCETAVASGNADIGSLGFITNIYIRGSGRITQKFSGSASPLWEDNNMIIGYPARATLQLGVAPSLIYGNWNDFIIGDWAANEVIVDPYSLSMQQQVRIVVHQLTDCGIRHPKSFVCGVA